MHRKKSHKAHKKAKEERIITVKKNHLESRSDTAKAVKMLKTLQPTRSFEASLSTLEEFTDNVMDTIKKEQTRLGRYWKTTLKDYYTASDSRLLRIVKIVLTILTVGISILMAVILFNVLRVPIPVSSGFMYLIPVVKTRRQRAGSREQRRSCEINAD